MFAQVTFVNPTYQCTGFINSSFLSYTSILQSPILSCKVPGYSTHLYAETSIYKMFPWTIIKGKSRKYNTPVTTKNSKCSRWSKVCYPIIKDGFEPNFYDKIITCINPTTKDQFMQYLFLFMIESLLPGILHINRRKKKPLEPFLSPELCISE